MDSSEKSILSNIESLENIVKDILAQVNHNVMTNLDILEGLKLEFTPQELRDLADKIDNGSESDSVSLGVFKATAIEALVRSPVKISTGRIAGLLKVVRMLKAQYGNSVAKFPK